jgi:ACT domain-containing protein
MASKNNIQLDLFNLHNDIPLNDKREISDSLQIVSIAVSLDEIVNQLRFSNLINILNSSKIKGNERLELLKGISGGSNATN